MSSEIPSQCTSFHRPLAHAVINLTLLLLIITLSGSRVYSIVPHASTSGFAYLSLFLGALCHISMASLAAMASNFVIDGTACLPWIGSLGFGILAGLFLLLSSIIMMISSLITFFASTYHARQRPPDAPVSTPATTQRTPLSATDMPHPSTALTISILTIIYFIFAFIPSFGIALTSPIAFWFTDILFFLVFTTPFLAIVHALPQALLLVRRRPDDSTPRPFISLLTLTAETILYILLGISYRQAIAEGNPGDLELVRGWGILPVMLANWLWMGYVIMGTSQGIMVAAFVGLWARRYWAQNEQDEMNVPDDGGEGGGGAEGGLIDGAQGAFNNESTAAAVHGDERVDDENQPLLGNRG